MKMGMKKPGAEMAKTIDDKVNERIAAEMAKVRVEIEKKAKEDLEKALKAENEKKALEEGNRVSTIIDDLKAKSAKVMGGEKGDVKTGDIKASIDCPTCHSHTHVVGDDGLTVKCTGPNCGKELVMISKTANYKCSGCGIPLEVSKEKNIDKCPYCSAKKALKFDWSKIAKVSTGNVQGPMQAAK